MADDVVRKEWLADGRIAAYRLQSLGTEAAELWVADVKSLFDDPDKPVLMLVDIRDAESNLLSADGLQVAREIAQIDHAGKTAFIVDKSKPALDTLIMYLKRALFHSRPREVFESEADAVAWLLSE